MNPYWVKIEGIRIAIVPRPRGEDWLADDISLLRKAGVDVLVSALTLGEVEELGLGQESEFCEEFAVKFLSFAIEDLSVPSSFKEFDEFLDSVIEHLLQGKAVGVHCRAGIGRSSMIVASILIRNGLSPESAFKAISESRGFPVPNTPGQREWVERNYSTRSGSS